ncbi:uncharacterized protein LOC142981227 isoform X2 [Anticarsia gemmatalis]|uniref:uncharacterized protein LOC142981227 isoform X2 n=1 Tax=Anticarsia gemmatalis TaxID=129554 RepID=UPI003F758E86
MSHRDNNSMETILTYDNRETQDQWSTVWSTSDINALDAAGRGGRLRVIGRRRLRLGSLALGALLTMHCRVSASALTGGLFIFMMFLVLSVFALANPLRHFEVYLGQWSINGPGRAFRIIPLFDGIGIAMCINAIVRAINCCTIAAIAATYVLSSLNDDQLPFKYCRTFELHEYNPALREIKYFTLKASRISSGAGQFEDEEDTTVGLVHQAWRNASRRKYRNKMKQFITSRTTIQVCKETYPGSYPVLYSTPAYNFFYVEVVRLRPGFSLKNFNGSMVLHLFAVWIIIWIIMISERLSFGRLIWNNMAPWILVVPLSWTVFLTICAASNLSLQTTISGVFQIDGKDVVDGVADAFEVALYIHSASVGTELITGKGLNRYASGHIDPALNNENVWHSALVLLLTGLHSIGATLCSLVDSKQPNSTGIHYDMLESTLWTFPLYSKCTSMGQYSHFATQWVFFGLTFSYIAVAFVLLKTALHTIFEYKVKLVFREQQVVAILITVCAMLSMIFATQGGLALLESVETMMTGVAMPLICLLELIALLYVYASRDFLSDVNVSMEEHACSARIGLQWQIIPFVTLGVLITKITVIIYAEMPRRFMLLALIPLMFVILAIPIRATQNIYSFLRPTRNP